MEKAELEQLRNNPKHWKLGVIYYCPDDPRTLVRNRHWFGWTWNFGNPVALVIMLALAGVVIGSAFIIMLAAQQVPQ